MDSELLNYFDNKYNHLHVKVLMHVMHNFFTYRSFVLVDTILTLIILTRCDLRQPVIIQVVLYWHDKGILYT